MQKRDVVYQEVLDEQDRQWMHNVSEEEMEYDFEAMSRIYASRNAKCTAEALFRAREDAREATKVHRRSASPKLERRPAKAKSLGDSSLLPRNRTLPRGTKRGTMSAPRRPGAHPVRAIVTAAA